MLSLHNRIIQLIHSFLRPCHFSRGYWVTSLYLDYFRPYRIQCREKNENRECTEQPTGDMKQSMLKLDECRSPSVITYTAGDDALSVEWRPTYEERHRHCHCNTTHIRSVYRYLIITSAPEMLLSSYMNICLPRSSCWRLSCQKSQCLLE